MKCPLATVVALGALAAPVAAQERPTPGPEHARLAYYAGTWKYEAKAHPSPMGAGGAVMATETCGWFDGGFQMVCRSEGTNPMGPVKAQGVMAWDPAEQTYTYYGITSQGDSFFVRGNVTGKAWNWATETTIQGTPMKFRATTTEQSPTVYTFKLEMSVAGGEWMVLEEGKSTKQ